MNSNRREPTGLLKLIGLPLASYLPEVKELASLFPRVSRLPYCIFLDSAQQDPQLGRYSFLAADPFELIEVPIGHEDPLAELQHQLEAFRVEARNDLPPFQGGAAGLFAYELAESFEATRPPQHNEFQIPAMRLGLYDVVIATDHVTQNTWILSQGWPETDEARRRARAHQRLMMFQDLIESSRQEDAVGTSEVEERANILAPHHPVEGQSQLFSNFSAIEYQSAVTQVIEYIKAGDIFQANLSQRLLTPARGPAAEAYMKLRSATTAPFAGYFDGGDFQVISASPERFLSVRQGMVEARPIKGTRPIVNTPEVDMANATDLANSEKDRAENVMIVDLLRNDLSRVCESDSLAVSQLCGVESYGYVQHLVSVIRGRLREDQAATDAIAAAFPGGSITGAPKLRAREIITELEQVARGAYCGCMGYVGFDGTMDLSILIRTITACRGWWQMPVGGGITAKSNPASEWQETWDKAAGLLKALR